MSCVGVNAGKFRLTVAPSDPSPLYAQVANSATNGLLDIYKTTDSGATWRALRVSGSQWGTQEKVPLLRWIIAEVVQFQPAILETDETHVGFEGRLDQKIALLAGECHELREGRDPQHRRGLLIRHGGRCSRLRARRRLSTAP